MTARAKKAKKVIAHGMSRTPLRCVFMAALKWARQEIDDEVFSDTIIQAAEGLKRGDP